MWSEPASLNPYLSSGINTLTVAATTLEGLARGAPDGTYQPILAAEVPTQANGDVSSDGTVVTSEIGRVHDHLVREDQTMTCMAGLQTR